MFKLAPATWFHRVCLFCSCAFPPSSLAYFLWERGEQRTVRLMSAASNTLRLPLRVYLLQRAREPRRDETRRRGSGSGKQRLYFWTVCSPAAPSFIPPFAYLSQHVDTESKSLPFGKQAGGKKKSAGPGERSLRLAQVVNNNECACRCWCMHAFPMSVHLAALLSACVCVSVALLGCVITKERW